MIFDPKETEQFRKLTEVGYSSGGYDMRKKCSKCGQKRRIGDLSRSGGGSRFRPTVWSCKGGCQE